jgi:hypothetical protein
MILQILTNFSPGINLWFILVKLFTLFWPLSAVANSDVSVILSVVQKQAVVGESIVWQMAIEFPDTQVGTSLKILSGDRFAWEIQDTDPLPNTLKASQTISINVIPLQKGALKPSLVISYDVEDITYTRMVESSEAVQVSSVPDLINANLLPMAETLPNSRKAGYLLEIANNSPFTITAQIVPIRSISYDGFFQPISIPPDQSDIIHITATLNTDNMLPFLALVYSWSDSTLNNKRNQVTVFGTPVQLPEPKTPLFLKILQETGIWFGTLFGALVGFGVTVINEWRSRWSKRRDDQQQTVSLLQWAIFQAKYATDHDENVDFQSLETVFKTQSLYAIASHLALIKPAWEFWEAGANYNANIASRQGLQRSTELTDRAHILQKLIEDKGLIKEIETTHSV